VNNHTLLGITAALTKALQEVWCEDAASITNISVARLYTDIRIEVRANQQSASLVYPAPYLEHSPDIALRMWHTAKELRGMCVRAA